MGREIDRDDPLDSLPSSTVRKASIPPRNTSLKPRKVGGKPAPLFPRFLSPGGRQEAQVFSERFRKSVSAPT